jgi:uncharacterized protein (TIGR03066 family)
MMFALIVCFANQARAADATNAEKIVGAWIVVKFDGKEAPKGKDVVFEFTKDGKLKLAPGLNGTYKVNGDKVTLTIMIGGKDDTDSITIKTLTVDTMVVIDDKGKEMEFKKKK